MPNFPINTGSHKLLLFSSIARPSERLVDVFQDEIIQEFHSKSLWRRFALSQHGLVLTMGDVSNIEADYPQNQERQKMAMLELWEQRTTGSGKIYKYFMALTIKNAASSEKNSNS